MNFWLKLKVWTKLIFLVLLVIYIAMFTIFNSGKPTEIWLHPFTDGKLQSSVLMLALGAFAFGVIAALLTRTIVRTVSQMRHIQRKRLEKEAAAIISRAAKLQVRQQPVPAGDAQGFPVVPVGEKNAPPKV
ncbi:MAG: hypothetical protein H7144_16425 [Burkholderiales bacterium]|nr:hypothetical protein [Phycisphaerae bacterium]